MSRNTRREAPRALPLALALWLAACGSFNSSTTQGSSESLSDSSSSLFDSSSSISDSSSGDDEAEAAYRRDVSDYVAAAADSGDVPAFQRRLGSIAEGHGVTDWERLDGTYLAIGRGLAEAGVGHRRYEQLAVALSSRDRGRLALIRAGYESGAAP